MTQGVVVAVIITLVAPTVVGCTDHLRRQAAMPLDQRYVRQSWAQVSVQQADAECLAEINRVGGIPNMYLCMRSKGWLER